MRVRVSTPDVVEHAEELPDLSARTFVCYMTLSADGDLMVFEGRAAGGTTTDLFASERDEAGNWSTPFPLESINTASGEGTPYLSPDGKRLFFTSDRPVTPESAATANLFVVDLDAALARDRGQLQDD